MEFLYLQPSASFLLALLGFQSAVLKSWAALKISADFRLLLVVLLLSVLCEFCTNVSGREIKERPVRAEE